MKNRALVFVNGELDEATLRRCAAIDDALLVCVDGGLRHCLAMQRRPDLIIGDLDSADQRVVSELINEGVEVIRYPVEKDATDLELTLRYLSDSSISWVTMVGVAGGRLDQTLANLMLLAACEWPFKLDFLDSAGDGFLVTPNFPFNAQLPIDTTVSLLPLINPVHGVITKGLKYALTAAVMLPGNTLGISNVVNQSDISISTQVGILLVIAKR